jgi:hypothetical protein
MKKIALLLLLISCFYSCKKANGIKTFTNEIIGTWELQSIAGPFNQPSFLPGNGRIIVFEEDGIFERKQHDTLVFRGSFFLKKRKDCFERSTDITLSTNESSNGDYQYIELSNGKLLLSTPNCYQDGGVATYRRL